MESMALGKPVIATAWSGNMSFMDYRCGCPVRYRTTRVMGSLGFLRPDFVGRHARWAEPLIEDAVAWMRRLHGDSALRLALGAAAKAAIDEHQLGLRHRGIPCGGSKREFVDQTPRDEARRGPANWMIPSIVDRIIQFDRGVPSVFYEGCSRALQPPRPPTTWKLAASTTNQPTVELP